jgi:hypothetical protein
MCYYNSIKKITALFHNQIHRDQSKYNKIREILLRTNSVVDVKEKIVGGKNKKKK